MKKIDIIAKIAEIATARGLEIDVKALEGRNTKTLAEQLKNLEQAEPAPIQADAGSLTGDEEVVEVHSLTMEDGEKVTLTVVENGVKPEGDTQPEVVAEEEKPKKGSIVPLAYKKKYGAEGHCGDELAEAMAHNTQNDKGELDLKKLESVAAQNGVDLLGRWGHLNNGQMRMNLSNVLRGRIKRGEFAQVGDAVWNVPEATAANA